MARIFNIYFNYNNTPYSAIVSVRATPFFTEYTLSSLDEELINLLPGNKIISKTKNHFAFKQSDTPDFGYSETLMNDIIKAVSQHMQSITV